MTSDGVTIAIPNWNHELFLPRSISSALAAVKQLREAGIGGEVLVVDDQSRDGSVALLRQLEALYFDQGLRVLALKTNGGVCRARNQALLYARYRHVVLMDADNEIVPENVACFHRAMTDTGAAVVYGNLIVKNWSGAAMQILSNESFQPRMFEQNYIDNFAMVDRRQAFDLIGGYHSNPRIQSFGDWEFFLSLAVNGARLVFVPVVMGIYYQLPGSMVQENLERNRDELALIHRTYDQVGIRQRMPVNTRHLRYHPDVGYC